MYHLREKFNLDVFKKSEIPSIKKRPPKRREQLLIKPRVSR